jgi:hypothetical protein
VSDPRRIETLVAAIESLDPAAQTQVRELLAAVFELHRDGLSRACEALAGAGLLERLARDPAVSAVLLLHDLHPVGLEQRARTAVDRARSHLAVEGCTVELLSVEGGIVRVRLDRSPGHHATAEEVRTVLRDAIWGEAPDVEEVRIEGQVAPGRNESSLVQLRAAAGRP